MYSLSKSSENVLDKIDDLLTMKVYFSDDLPGELSNTQRFLQDLLEEYEAQSDNIRFFFTNPESNEELEEEARKDGIQPVQMQVVEDDKLEIKRVYLGMVILYEDKKETIPVIQTATGLEYLITTKIKTLVNKDKKTSRHIVGSDAAIRVKSRKPAAEYFITSLSVTFPKSSATPTIV